MKVLLVTHFYPPEMGGGAARLHGLARWLVHYGHQVTVVTGLPNYPDGVVAPGYRRKLRMREEMDGVDVLRTWVYPSSHEKKVRRLANYFSFVGSGAVAGLTGGRGYDVVLASSPPPFAGLVGVAAARLRGIPLVLDIRDIWPDVAIESEVFSAEAFLARAGHRLARFLCRQADHITPVTDEKRAKLIGKGVPAVKLTVVANGADLDQANVPRNDDKRAALGLDGKFVVLYAGLIGHAQGVGVAIEAAERLKTHEDVHFLIVGDGVQRDALFQELQNLALANVTMLPRQPPEEIPSFLAAADASLVPLVNDDIKTAVPSKLLEAWAHRRPVLLAAAGEAADLVREGGGGIVTSPGDPIALAESVLELKRDREGLKRYADRGHRYVCKHHDRRALARQMEAVLEDVVRRSRREE